jgi:hypothetical protein
MKKQTLKAIGIVFIGLLIWIGMIYLGFAFLKAEANPFIWSQALRAAMLFITFCYLVFAPLMINELDDWL